MTETKPTRISDRHPSLDWAERHLLDYIYENSPTLADVRSATSATNYANKMLLRHLKQAGLIRHKQARVGNGAQLGESRYFITDLALAGTVPAGTEE